MLTSYKERLCGIHLRAIWLWVPELLFCLMSETFTFEISAASSRVQWVNSLTPGESGWNLTDKLWNAFSWMKRIVFLFKFHWSLFPGVQWHWQQVMAWHWMGTKPLPEPMITYICVTRHQWVSASLWFLPIYMYSLPQLLFAAEHFCPIECIVRPSVLSIVWVVLSSTEQPIEMWPASCAQLFTAYLCL